MDTKKSGILLAKINVVFFFIVKGALIVSICADSVIRNEANEHFGFDVMYVGVAGIAAGCLLMALISRYERTGRIGI